MKNKPEHTPTPWKVLSNFNEIVSEDGEKILFNIDLEKF